MPKINPRIIYSISTGLQPSEPLPKDTVSSPAAGMQYIQRQRYVYRWSTRQERDLDTIKLYEGTVTPLPSQIQFYCNSAKRIIPIFEKGNEVEPPLLEDWQIPSATVVTTREFLSDIPAPQRRSSALRKGSPFDLSGRPSCRNKSKKASKRAAAPSPTSNDTKLSN